MIKLSLLILFFVMLFSCSKENIIDERSYKFSIPEGSKLILNREIIISSGMGRTFFQSGKVTAEKDLNIYYPHCSITINTLKDNDQIIKPASFNIIKVIDDEEYVQGYILYASNNIKISSDGPLITGLVSYYYLESKREPDVRTLECIQWDTPYENRHLSIEEVRKSLGNIFSLIINKNIQT
ncbi:MAG: hypothetical protein DIZ80_05895 [endosymbiont of Galathealinum brachiosum]|uniref:Uncharacterized protein n=1 Tax=endosymbiont of Galathealinum brachiosum TaxID=2200906 RepID=A0A370DJB0_9GAMM|nr:MAG: hypothetical protein DIZ80_05895 [endosymbiont of Galathealinum brachiosum]